MGDTINWGSAGFSAWLGDSDGYGLVLWLFAVVFAVVIVNFAVQRLLLVARLQVAKTRTFWDDAFFEAVYRPLSVLVWVLGLSWIAEMFYRRTDTFIFGYADDVRKVAVLVLLIWFVVRFIRQVERGLVATDLHQSQFDQSAIQATGKLLRTAVLVTGAMLVLQALGYNISSVLAVGSIGGLAISFAAKDLLANFFGGLMVYLDRPFAVGDWIRSPDRDIEGTVERIGWRTTCIRTFDKRPLYVPNSTFSNIAVENPSRMSNRRIYETLGIRYADAAAMASIVDAVKAMLLSHPAIDPEQTLIVNFNRYADSSLEFFVYTFTKTTQWVEYHQIKQDVLTQIGNIIRDHGAEIAFPTQTLEVHNK